MYSVIYKFRLIRLSSPSLNNVVVAGCIVCYVAAILFGLDDANPKTAPVVAVCHVSETLAQTTTVQSFTDNTPLKPA
jgi:hypothetical protein